MISKFLFLIIILFFAFYIGKKIKLPRILSWFSILIGLLNGIGSLIGFIQSDYNLSFNYFLGCVIFTILGLLNITVRDSHSSNHSPKSPREG